MRSALCLVVLAGCLDPSPSPPPPTAPAPRLLKAPLPSLEVEADAPPQFATEPVAFDATTELRDPVRDGRLALLPMVTAGVPAPDQRYLTLQAGLASGQVTAFDGGDIFSITISNRSELPLAILGGELVVGGQQDRLVVKDTVIAPHRSMAIATLCAELGRMEGGAYFRASHVLAEPTLRRLARAGDQGGVWSRIEALDGRPSTSYRHAARAQRSGVNADRLRHLVAELDGVDHREERSKTVGFAVAIDDKVVAIEHFASPELYRDLRELVIASYLPRTVGRPHGEATVGPRDVLAFKEQTGEGAPRPPRSPAAAPSGARPAHP